MVPPDFPRPPFEPPRPVRKPLESVATALAPVSSGDLEAAVEDKPSFARVNADLESVGGTNYLDRPITSRTDPSVGTRVQGAALGLVAEGFNAVKDLLPHEEQPANPN